MRRLLLDVGPDIPPGLRIDKFLCDVHSLCTRSQLKISLRKVLQNGRPVKASRTVLPGASLEVFLDEPEAAQYGPQDIALDILYEDERVIVLNKPAGMVVHPGCGVSSGTLVQGLLAYSRELAENFQGEGTGISGSGDGTGRAGVRPGIVHRLDKDTSGVIITAKDPEGREFLARQFRARTARKVYVAVVRGSLPALRGEVEGFIKRDPRARKRFMYSTSGGKAAQTLYRTLASRGGYTLARLKPRTGRTHQLRVHMKSLGCPVVGDSVYGRGGEDGLPLMLHARSLCITLPGEDSPRTFRAPFPGGFIKFLRFFYPENPEYRG